MVCLQSTEEVRMDTKKIKGLTLFVCTGIVIVSDYLLQMAVNQLPLPGYAGLCLTRLIQISAVLFLVIRFEGDLQGMGLSGPDARKGVQRGLIWSMAFAGVAALGFVVLELSGIHALPLIRTRLPGQPVDRILFFIAGGLIAPLAEEVFFRGLLFGYLRRWGFIFALLMSTGIFVLIHSFSGIPVPQIVGGLVFATCYEKEKTLWAPIVIHATGNIALFTLSLL